jgi:hypothetical protein
VIFLTSITWNNVRMTGITYDHPVDRVIREEKKLIVKNLKEV